MCKIFFTINFVRNIYKFYNFIGNNYLKKIISQLKFLEKNNKKKICKFFQQICNKILMWEFLITTLTLKQLPVLLSDYLLLKKLLVVFDSVDR